MLNDDWLLFNDLPEELEYIEPQSLQCKAMVLQDDVDRRHRQLIVWCAIQSLWYWCLSEQHISNEAYDKVKAECIRHELKEGPSEYIDRWAAPIHTLQWGNKWFQQPSRYPDVVQEMFGVTTMKTNIRLSRSQLDEKKRNEEFNEQIRKKREKAKRQREEAERKARPPSIDDLTEIFFS